ncbi:hypothetical protein DXG01_009061 [Tephrocybe rancida]|nr:hypothetical protein DXG01_009061 [Tephrocybe rancida]
MHLQALLNLLPFYLICTSTAFGQGGQKPVLNDVTDAYINDLLKGWNSPGGVAVAVVRGGEDGTWNVETKGYGVATLADGSRVTETTLFAIGSNSKLFDAIATGLLISNETISPRLTWTTKLTSVIPGWGLIDPIAEKQATIVDALSHRIGLPRHGLSYRWSDDIPTLIKKMRYQRPSAEFREVFQYSNNPYTVLSYLPTVLLPSKIPFARYVKQHIFEPLGLASTTFSYDIAKLGHLAEGMTRQGTNFSENSFGGTPRVLPFWSTRGGEDGNLLSGAGGIISNAVDMAIWLQILLLDGQKPGTNQSIIPSAVLAKLSEGVSVASPTTSFSELSISAYGGGQVRSSYRGHDVLEHDGGTPGFWSQVTRLPFDGIGVAVLCNDYDYGGALMASIKFRLIDEALGLEPVDWDARFKPPTVLNLPLATPRPANVAPPSTSFTDLAGKYYSNAYGPLELCLVSPDFSAASSTCKALAANVSTILPGAVDPSIPTFIAAWDSPAITHIRLRHFNGDHFNISLLNSLPTNNISEPYWTFGGETLFEVPAYAEISTSSGRKVGLSINGLWGAGEGINGPRGNTANRNPFSAKSDKTHRSENSGVGYNFEARSVFSEFTLSEVKAITVDRLSHVAKSSKLDDSSETQQSREKELYRRRLVHHHYIKNTEEYNEFHHAVSSYPKSGLRRRRRLFCHARDLWEGETLALKVALIEATENWEPLTGGGSPCPVVFDTEDVRETMELDEEQRGANETIEVCWNMISIRSEGQTSTEHYEEAITRSKQLTEGALAEACSENDRAEIAAHWPLDDMDEKEYM